METDNAHLETPSPQFIPNFQESTSSLSELSFLNKTTPKKTHAKDSMPSPSDRRKELTKEDEIFFKDDPRFSDVSENDFSDESFCGSVQRDQLTAARRRQMIQDLLASFDLEEVMDRYRGDTVHKSLNKRRYRKWLLGAMSEEQANFNDRQWNEQFRQQVLEEYERKLDDKERRLADAESQRILKLKILGILRDEEDETRKAQVANRKTMAEKRFDNRIARKHHSLFKPNDIETQMEIMNRDESEVRRRIMANSEHSDGVNGSTDDDSLDLDSTKLPTYKSQLGRMKSDTEDVHPQLRDLYEQEDLNQLYKEAENLVRRATRNK